MAEVWYLLLMQLCDTRYECW